MAGIALAGCTPQQPAGPKAPVSVTAEGRYAYEVSIGETVALSGDNPANVSLTRVGGLYTGTVLSGPWPCPEGVHCPQGYVELTTSGHSITSLYTRDNNLAPGVGYELVDTTPTTVENTTDCPDGGLDINFDGPYTLDGGPDPDNFSSVASFTICDAAMADWFA
jgi:hypothetical protein